MSFITEYNARRIVYQLDKDKIDTTGKSVYKKPIYFFNQREKRHLLVFRILLEDFEHVINEYYRKVEAPVDEYEWIYEGSAPAYHAQNDCELLNSDYVNFKVPEEIQEEGKEEVIAFREWFKQNLYLLDCPDALVARLNARFGTRVRPSQVSYSNSGVEEKKNYELQELEEKIDDILRKAGKFYRRNPDLQGIIKKFGKRTFLAQYDEPIRINNSDMPDDELKAFMREYDKDYKMPTKKLLYEYYRVMNNPEMSFEGQLLDQIGFQPCPECT